MSINPIFYSEDVKKIDKIEFSIFRNKDVKQYSAVSSDPFGIDLAESYENYEPKKGGLVDLRLGTCDIYLPCTTCGENSLECPGHFGHTQLAEPVFHFGYLNHLKNILQCICLKCSNLLVEKSDNQFKKALIKKSEARYKEIKILTKNVNYCYHCGVPVPKIKREVKDNGSIKIMIERDINTGTGNEKEEIQANIKKIKESLSPRDCYNILRNVSETDCYLLGFNPKMHRPEDMIIENFPIPPVIIRPTAKVDFMSSATMEDSLTLKISDIITSNKRVRQQMEKETISNELSTYNQDIFNLLQYHVATYFDNESVSLPRTEFKTGGRTTKSISDRIKGKAGRVRSNLMGKRVDFSARSVITSDPYIDIDQVGVPKKIAMELTIPEEVTPFNIKYLTGLVKNGRDVYPGANFVLRVNYRDGKSEIQKIDLKYRKKAIRLNFGDVVERHSVDGDYVLFNRQPTLHKPSMMGHKIQVIDNDSLNAFRMNVSVCKPYNADFDGDEMNIHLAQSIQARNELKRIANVQYQIVGAKDSSPIIGCQQDTLSGAYMLSEPNVRIKGWEVANILCNTTSDTKYEIEMNKEYTGHEVFSHIIPAGINNTIKSGDKITFQITNGKLTTGYLDKASLSFAKNSIIHFIWDKFGPNKTRRFIDDSQRLVLNYLLLRGQTVGFKDTVVDNKMQQQIQQIISQKILESKYAITQYENDIDQNSSEMIEANLTADLSSVQANIGQILMSYFDTSNFFWTSAKSGAKGNSTNVAQVSGVLGQNNVEGSRFKKKVEGRALIYWHKDDDTPEARGFIKSSFLSGLRGFEFFYNAAAGREGLIDTAIKSVTWETPIVIIENRQPLYTPIGKWIDGLLDNNKDKVQFMEEQNMEIMDLQNGVYIPTTDYEGKVSWGEISAITRHDPGKQLYEIKTSGGRSVIVTESKSLLIWNTNTKQFKEKLTPEINVGDFVPVTMELTQPPITLKHIDVSKYLSKNEYIYGSEYHKSIQLMNEAMENREKIPAGWWESNNGKMFTLPYTKKLSLQRSLIRSNQYNICIGCVYPYAANRSEAKLPEQFELNEANGIFIGLFLAEGSISHESVRITNINENVKTFVKSWFDSHLIKWTEEDKINKIGGHSVSIRGYSAILTRFLTNLVGKGAENKFVPSEAFIAPENFVIGLLNGYFSGDGCITKNSIDASSSSKRLIEGINMLCSRIGVFCKVYTTQIKSNNLRTKNIKPSHRLRISAQWAKKFSEKVTLLENDRNKKIKEKKWSLKHLNFETLNDVVLDPITEIKLVDVKDHPKVYDLTIPTTFNFGLANGLQVRDTAQTGYIQRQLIKGLEDLSIRYDGTNRNARGTIVQTVYGENGINQATQTELKLNILGMDNKTLVESLTFSPEQIKKLEKATKVSSKELNEFNTKHIERLKGLRDEMRQIQSKALINYKILEEKFVLPVNLFRITQDYSNHKEFLELKPQEIVDAIESFLSDYDNRLITSLKPTDKFMKKDDRNLKFLLEVALNEYLAPVKCIFEYGLTRKEFNEMMKEIKMSFIKAIVEPGEMVGIIAAQSVGEPTSQMSVHQETNIKFVIKDSRSNTIELKTVQIGELCDEIIKTNPSLTINTGHVNSVETDLTTLPNEYYIIGVDGQEETHWNKISHVSRHPVNGQLMTVETRSGRKVTTTLSHSHLIRANQTVKPITGSDLKVGMRIPVAKHIANTFIKDTIKIGTKEYQLDYLFGWFVGAYLAEGHVSNTTIGITNVSEKFINNTILFAQRHESIAKPKHKQGEYGPSTTTLFANKLLADFILDTMDTGSFVKRVPDFAFTAPNEFKAGLIQGYFDGDGNFQADETRNQIRVCSRSKQLINDIGLLLTYFGIFGSIKEQTVKAQPIYNMCISARYAPEYQTHIGSLLHREKLAHIVAYAQRDDAHNLSDEIDKINGLGEIIAKCGKTLALPGQSRTYGRWAKKESIGRRTLSKYVSIFESDENASKIQPELRILKQALNSDVIWDEIIDIKTYTPDQTEYVYDFTVPGNQTFMVDSGIIVHNTLNTKHFAGVASKGSANMGVSRILELLHYTKNIKTPQMTIYFKDQYSTDRSALNKVVSYFKHLSIRHLISSAEVFYDVGHDDDFGKKIKGDNVSTPFFVNNQKADISSLPFVFRIKLDIEKMIEKETTLLDIKTKFIAHWYKNYTNLKNLKKNEKEVISRISRCAILSNSTTYKEQIIHIRFSMSSFNYNIITEFLRMVFDDITLKGIENILSIDVSQERIIKYDKETGAHTTEKEYVVTTAGINFEKMRIMKGIDLTRVKSNDIASTLRLYGIEATRQILLHELTETYTAGGSKINQNHLSLLIDQMCHLGEITSMDRHGLSKIDMDPIARASFEKTMDHFINASIFNEKDTMKSVSSRIAVGRVIPGGTGSFDLLLDTKKLENSEYTENETGGRITFKLLEEDPLLQDIVKHDYVKHGFFMPLLGK